MKQLPHITVATVIESNDKFLMVKEKSDGSVVYNQPAGHLENGESLIEAAIRETMEETAWRVAVTALVGIYQYTSPYNGVNYVRHCFVATAEQFDADARLDEDILEANWYTAGFIIEHAEEMRSPIVLRSLQDYLDGVRYPLQLLNCPLPD